MKRVGQTWEDNDLLRDGDTFLVLSSGPKSNRVTEHTCLELTTGEVFCRDESDDFPWDGADWSQVLVRLG